LGWVLTNVCGVVGRLAAAVRQSAIASVAVVDAALSAVRIRAATETELAAALSALARVRSAALSVAEHGVGVFSSAIAPVAVVDAALSAVRFRASTETELAAALSALARVRSAALSVGEHGVGVFSSAIAPVAVVDAALSAVRFRAATETELAAALSARAGVGSAALSLGQRHPDQGAHEDEPRENRSRLVHCRHG
jgi:anthranilate phosphoribosyltransferase